MFYFAIFDGNVTNIAEQRRICVMEGDYEAAKLCSIMSDSDYSQIVKLATLHFSLLALVVLYLPTLIYVTVISVKHFPKNMTIHDKAILFILPMFTNLCFIQPPEKQIIIDCRNMKPRSKSESDICTSLSKPVQMSRSKSFINFKTFHWNTEKPEPNISLVHSNGLYVIFFFGSVGDD